MTRFRFDKVELLDRKHPGLQQFVDACYDEGIPGHIISKELKNRYQVDISSASVQRYRQTRYLPHLNRIQNRVERLEGTVEYKKRHPEGPLREALIFEKLFEMPADLLHRRDVDLKRLAVQKRKLAIDKKRAETQAQALSARLRGAKEARGRGQNRKAVNDEKADPAEVRRRIREIYGLHDPPSGAGTPACGGAGRSAGATDGLSGSGPASPVPGEVVS